MNSSRVMDSFLGGGGEEALTPRDEFHSYFQKDTQDANEGTASLVTCKRR